MSNTWGCGRGFSGVLSLCLFLPLFKHSSPPQISNNSKMALQSSKRRMRKRSRAQRPLAHWCRQRWWISRRGTISLATALVDVNKVCALRNFQSSSRFTFLVLYRWLWFPRTTSTNVSRLWFSHYRSWSMDGSGETRFAAVRFTVPG